MTSNTGQGKQKKATTKKTKRNEKPVEDEEVLTKNPNSYPEVISCAVRLQASHVHKTKYQAWHVETFILPLVSSTYY